MNILNWWNGSGLTICRVDLDNVVPASPWLSQAFREVRACGLLVAWQEDGPAVDPPTPNWGAGGDMMRENVAIWQRQNGGLLGALSLTLHGT